MQCEIFGFILFFNSLLQMSETMAAAEEVKFSLRVLINKENKKVLFAEVDNHFANTLISFLALPLGTIVRLLAKHYGDEAPVIGSLNTLYTGLENLDVSNFWTEAGKLMLLNPINPYQANLRELKLNIDNTGPGKLFVCQNQSCITGKSQVCVSMYFGTAKCQCGSLMSREVKYPNEVGCGLYTTETASFILSDDLQMMPNSVGFGYDILKSLGFDGTYKVEEKTFIVGFEEVMDLLKGSLISRTPLTDLIFKKTQKSYSTVNSEFCSLIGKNATTSAFKQTTVKVIVQKSTGKILLAQSTEVFVDFLFSVLTIPLGNVISLLGGDSSFGSIHNIFKSLACLYNHRYLKYQNAFIKPNVPLRYLSKHMLFPITEKTTTPCYLCNTTSSTYLSYYSNSLYSVGTVCDVILEDPKGQESYIKGPTMFSVSDDLVVTPMSTISEFCFLNSLKIPICDIEEQLIDIGVNEALSILNASLFSKSALNNGLKHLLKRQPKEEK